MREMQPAQLDPKQASQNRGAFRVMLGAAVLVALGLFGCGRDRAPVSPSDPAEPQFLSVAPSDGDAQDVSSGKGSPKSGSPISVKRMIYAAQGGTIVNGRYTLIIPPNALDRDVEYELQDANNGYAEVDLAPHGAQFHVPVTLVMDLHSSNANVFTQLFWRDDDHHTWVPMGGVYNPSTQRLTTSLPHFSKYRAGW